MDRTTKRHLQDLRHQRSYLENKQRKQELKLRKKQRKKPQERPVGKIWELADEETTVTARSSRRAGVDPESPVEENAADDMRFQAMVMSVSRAACTLLQNGMLVQCAVPLVEGLPLQVAAGDQVIARQRPGSGLVVDEVVPRRTVLSRPDPHLRNREKIVAANIDTVVHVVSVRNPPLRIRLIDRYLVAITIGGAEPMLCLTKIDLLSSEEADEEMKKLEPYHQLGLRVLPVSTRTGQGMEEVTAALAGKLVAFVGHSGVGKSSLLNALHPELDVRVGEVQPKRGTGRHTTTASSLYELPGGTRIIDTPGIREFGLWDLDSESLRFYFPEFTSEELICRFNDCTHDHEPQCAVKEAVEEGRLSRPRHETYLRILEDLRNPTKP